MSWRGEMPEGLSEEDRREVCRIFEELAVGKVLSKEFSLESLYPMGHIENWSHPLWEAAVEIVRRKAKGKE